MSDGLSELRRQRTTPNTVASLSGSPASGVKPAGSGTATPVAVESEDSQVPASLERALSPAARERYTRAVPASPLRNADSPIAKDMPGDGSSLLGLYVSK